MSTATGRAAEIEAVRYLKKQGFKILAQNWRTRWCEIDIVAQCRGVIYFVEVKYRANSAWGGGLDYITPRKLQQMNFAGEFWLAQQATTVDYRLAAIGVSGNPPCVDEWVPSIY